VGRNVAGYGERAPRSRWALAHAERHQYRLCFRWSAQGPEDVEIVDYHAG